MDYWFLLIGQLFCLGCGIIVVGIFITVSLNYLWKKLKDAHSFDKICKILRDEAKQANKK